MSSFTAPLAFAATDIFTGGSLLERPVLISGERVMVAELGRVRRLYVVTEGFSYEDRRHGTVWTVPTDFRTDLGSIPALARGLLSPDDPWAQAFVLHDLLYRMLAEGTAPVWLTRAKADLVLWDALALPFQVHTFERGALIMRRTICPDTLRSAIYAAVRVGGARAATPARDPIPVRKPGEPIIKPGV